MSFQVSALCPAQFQPLFELTDAQLAEKGMSRVIVDSDFGYPDRVTLEDAKIGDELILLNYEHQPAATAYKASGPVFVSQGKSAQLSPGEIPQSFAKRPLSLRAYDDQGMMVDAKLIDGQTFGDTIKALFGPNGVAYIHVHFALRGCFAGRVERAYV